MKGKKCFALAALLLTCFAFSYAENKKGVIEDITSERVMIKGSFWKDWQDKQSSSMIPAALNNTKDTVEAFEIAGEYNRGDKSRKSKKIPIYASSDLYKIMETAAYVLAMHRDADLERQIDKIIDLIAEAQLPDGYLYLPHICKIGNPVAGHRPYSNVIHSHEVYNLGHMYEGALAYYKATGKDKWLKISEKSIRHLDKVFFQGDPNYNDGKPVNQAPGHQEIEIALCKLSAASGNPYYLNLAKKFLDIRGVTFIPSDNGVSSASYAQQHAPVADQREPVGHVVRALYQYTAMASVDALYGSSHYDKALDSIWNNIASTRIHITGGLGAVASIEAFGMEYELPNKTTYNETCAAVANVFFNHKMFLRHKDAKYLDLLEVSLFNGALSGISISGDRFFYENPLEADGVSPFNHGEKTRSKWLSCACCPPNISRLLMQVSGYIYSHDNSSSIWVGLYATSEGKFEFAGSEISLKQESGYPYEGSAKITVGTASPKKFALRLRVPRWAESAEFMAGNLYTFADDFKGEVKLKVNGKAFSAPREKGFAVIEREWKNGDVVEIELPIKLRRVVCNPKVESNRGFYCYTLGPLVLCAEEADNFGRVQQLYIPKTSNISEAKYGKFENGITKGVPWVKISGNKLGENSKKEITLIPYFAWNNRGGDSMRVWIPENSEVAEKNKLGFIFPAMKHIDKISSSDGSSFPEVLLDGRVANSSSDVESAPVWVCKNKGEEVFIEVKFKKSMTFKSASVYFMNTYIRSCKPPKNWKVQYSLDGENFKDLDIYITDTYGTETDKFNIVHPSNPLECVALRFVFAAKEFSRVGISEILLEIE